MSTTWSAPGRVTLIGDHTDYNAGLSLPFGLDRRTSVTVRRADEPILRVRSDSPGAGPVSVPARVLELPEPPAVDGWAAYPIGMAWALAQAVPGAIGPFEATVTSDVPVGIGVSSSAALEMAVGTALAELFGLDLGPAELAAAGQRAENVAVGAPTGILDQTAVMFARRDHGVLIDFADLARRAVPLGLAAAGLGVLIIDSGTRHEHGTGGYGQRRAECAEATSVLGLTSLRELGVDDLDRVRPRLAPNVFRRVRHVVTENARTARVTELLDAGRAAEIGDLLTASHASMRDDFENSVPAIDAAVAAAVDAGALGARLFGGGFGGACLALVPTDRAEQLAAAITAGVVAGGHPDPVIRLAAAADGPRREPDPG
ncbi:galactokinase [Naumannella cuiyingiana]|uniref:Galactokinase n=1 Tax=Naumannella cuiyingiana TaxID=1347891 RepID=A0A7Z0D635_9ACTN|nr:galactokinase family protein [Naumannella cuiyingiana]NYI69554.1 galactokinase [Naumannella cuiyingiana]